MFTTNVDALNMTQNYKERYLVLDIDEFMKGNVKYFTALHAAIQNKDIQLAFYHEMIARFKTLDKWNEDVMPMSITKQQKIVDSLPRVYKYIKDEYILSGTDMQIETKYFFKQYAEKIKDQTFKEKLGRLFTKIGITARKVNKNNGQIQYYEYKYTNAQLIAIFEANSWMCETDQFTYGLDNDIVEEDESMFDSIDTTDKAEYIRVEELQSAINMKNL